MKELTAAERILILNLYDTGMGPIEIARLVGLRRTQMADYYLLTDVVKELQERKYIKTEEGNAGT